MTASDVYPADSGIGDPHDWPRLRDAALAAVRAAGARKAADIVDLVMDVLGEEAVNRMAARLLDDYRLRSMDFRDGASLDLEPSREMVARWVGAARGMPGDAPNYTETEVDLGLPDPPGVEMTVGLAGEERFVFRLQRRGKLTPHQARMRAEERAEAAEAVLAALRDLIPPERFRDMAAWFDTDDEFKTAMSPGTWPPDSRGSKTQDDLRAFADLLDVDADKP
jgi:hypothetical protein